MLVVSMMASFEVDSAAADQASAGERKLVGAG
jgi:hypothetical protein